MVWVRFLVNISWRNPELLVSLKEKMTNHRPDLCLIYYNSKRKEEKGEYGLWPGFAWCRLLSGPAKAGLLLLHPLLTGCQHKGFTAFEVIAGSKNN